MTVQARFCRLTSEDPLLLRCQKSGGSGGTRLCPVGYHKGFRGLWVYGFRGLGLRVWGFRVEGFRVSGFRVEGLGCRVSSGLRG